MCSLNFCSKWAMKLLAKFELQHVPIAVPNFCLKARPLKVNTLFDNMCWRNILMVDARLVFP